MIGFGKKAQEQGDRSMKMIPETCAPLKVWDLFATALDIEFEVPRIYLQKRRTSKPDFKAQVVLEELTGANFNL